MVRELSTLNDKINFERFVLRYLRLNKKVSEDFYNNVYEQGKYGYDYYKKIESEKGNLSILSRLITKTNILFSTSLHSPNFTTIFIDKENQISVSFDYFDIDSLDYATSVFSAIQKFLLASLKIRDCLNGEGKVSDITPNALKEELWNLIFDSKISFTVVEKDNCNQISDVFFNTLITFFDFDNLVNGISDLNNKSWSKIRDSLFNHTSNYIIPFFYVNPPCINNKRNPCSFCQTCKINSSGILSYGDFDKNSEKKLLEKLCCSFESYSPVCYDDQTKVKSGDLCSYCSLAFQLEHELTEFRSFNKMVNYITSLLVDDGKLPDLLNPGEHLSEIFNASILSEPSNYLSLRTDDRQNFLSTSDFLTHLNKRILTNKNSSVHNFQTLFFWYLKFLGNFEKIFEEFKLSKNSNSNLSSFFDLILSSLKENIFQKNNLIVEKKNDKRPLESFFPSIFSSKNSQNSNQSFLNVVNIDSWCESFARLTKQANKILENDRKKKIESITSVEYFLDTKISIDRYSTSLDNYSTISKLLAVISKVFFVDSFVVNSSKKDSHLSFCFDRSFSLGNYDFKEHLLPYLIGKNIEEEDIDKILFSLLRIPLNAGKHIKEFAYSSVNELVFSNNPLYFPWIKKFFSSLTGYEFDIRLFASFDNNNALFKQILTQIYDILINELVVLTLIESIYRIDEIFLVLDRLKFDDFRENFSTLEKKVRISFLGRKDKFWIFSELESKKKWLADVSSDNFVDICKKFSKFFALLMSNEDLNVFYSSSFSIVKLINDCFLESQCAIKIIGNQLSNLFQRESYTEGLIFISEVIDFNELWRFSSIFEKEISTMCSTLVAELLLSHNLFNENKFFVQENKKIESVSQISKERYE